MFRFFLSLRLVAAILALTAAAALTATTSGIVSSDETWSGTVTLTGEVICTSGTITVLPGTVVKFATTNDNVVYGGSGSIWITLLRNGGMSAVGTAQQPITFTSSSLAPARGSWGHIQMMALKNDANTTFKYCNFLYAQTALEWRNPSGENEVTQTLVENCTFSLFSASGMYGTSLCEVTVNSCTFHDLTGSGIFMHGSGPIHITDCIIYNTSCGIINASNTGITNQVMTIDHLTMYNIDMTLTTNPQWWTGYGIFCCNSPAQTMYLTNSIISTVSLYCMQKSTFTVNESYNCFYANVGLGSVQSSTPAGTDLETDPLFTDAANGDFSLDGASPCANAGDDGLSMGAVHAPAGIYDHLFAAGACVGLTAAPNPLSDRTTFSLAGNSRPLSGIAIYTPAGRLVRDLPAGTLSWDAHDTQGHRVAPGVYLVKFGQGAQAAQLRVMVAR
jgi:hypothetical protein